MAPSMLVFLVTPNSSATPPYPPPAFSAGAVLNCGDARGGFSSRRSRRSCLPLPPTVATPYGWSLLVMIAVTVVVVVAGICGVGATMGFFSVDDGANSELDVCVSDPGPC